MKVSIITATWNSGSTIADALESVASQKHCEIEHIIVDGASKDNTLDVISQSDSSNSITLISEPDEGIYDALNKGIAMATGDVIGFLHSDDIYASENVISKIVDAFANPNIDAVYSDLDYVSKEDTSKVIRHWKSCKFSRKKLLTGWMPPHPTFFMRKHRYEEYGSFNLKYKISADYDAILRYFGKNNLKAHYIPEVMVKMRVGGASNRSIKNIIRKSTEDFQALISNGLPPVKALLGKNLSKIPQFCHSLKVY